MRLMTHVKVIPFFLVSQLFGSTYAVYTYISTCVTVRGFTEFGINGIVKATVSAVLEDLTFKISEGSDQN